MEWLHLSNHSAQGLGLQSNAALAGQMHEVVRPVVRQPCKKMSARIGCNIYRYYESENSSRTLADFSGSIWHLDAF